MTDKQLDILVNIIGGVESGGQQYGNRRYDAYAAPYKNSPEEHTITLGWCQFYGGNARELCKRIFDKDKAVFRANDSANIENRLSQDWVAIKWNPSSAEKEALLKIITSSIGKNMQDEMFKEDMSVFIKDAESFGISDVGAQMMYCEIRHLGGKNPTERIFKRATKPYTTETVYASLLLDQNDTSNNNQVGDKKYQTRHEKCVEWIKKYIDKDSTTTENKDGDNMTVNEYIQKVIDIANAEIGYLEKKSNKNLDDKTANAGSNNYTKYGRDMHDLYPSVMDFPAAWCDAFVDWCFYKAYGTSTAKSLLCGNYDDYTVSSAQMYKNKGAWYKSNPKKGDQIFFTNASGGICHTGLVVDVTSTNVVAIEGNTSSTAGVVANGGCVRKKTYSLTYSRIAGYGRPAYEKFCASGVINQNTSSATSSTSKKLNDTKLWQGKTTSVLNVRTWAGVEYKTCSFSPLKKGTKVDVLDEVKAADGSTWYYIKKSGKTGFVNGKYIKKITSSNTDSDKSFKPYECKTTASSLNIRSGAGTSYSILGVLSKNTTCVIDQELNGFGKLQSRNGWISLKYIKKV